MDPIALHAIAQMLVTLASVPEEQQTDVLAAVVRTWCERESPWVDQQGSVELWRAVQANR
jgi:hypothetical protein